MKLKIFLLFTFLHTAGIFKSGAQEKQHEKPAGDTSFLKEQKVISRDFVTVKGNRINYRAEAGIKILKNGLGVPTIGMSYVAYFKEGEKATEQRPVTFIFNGGPGSSTIWLHMGAWGPQRVYLNDTARNKAPFKTVNNDYSLLDASDLVFIDAPGTGFGQVITKAQGGAGDPKDFFGIDQDGHAFASFITQFISDHNQWNSPKYLFGESYGTFRSAVVANILETEYRVSLNGIILLSQLLTYENMSDLASQHPGNDLPYALVLPSFAATSWYHHLLPNAPSRLEPFLEEVEQFAMNDFLPALNKGSMLDSISFSGMAEKLHNYTGLPVDYLRKGNLRISGPQFEHTLLGNDNEITGRLDSRFTGAAINPLGETPEYDPMDSYIDAAFTATLNNYMRTRLNFGAGMEYKVFGSTDTWDFTRKREGGIFPNVMADLAKAMILDPGMKVMLNMGYFDLGTPYYEGIYEMHHLPMPAFLQKNIEYALYYSGHMVYLQPESHKKLHDMVEKFIEETH